MWKNYYLKLAANWIWPILRSPDDLKNENKKKWKGKKEERRTLKSTTASNQFTLWESQDVFYACEETKLDVLSFWVFKQVSSSVAQSHRLMYSLTVHLKIIFFEQPKAIETFFYHILWVFLFISSPVGWAFIVPTIPLLNYFLTFENL